MAFKEVMDLTCDTTVALGGTNKQTGRPNPTQVEGYFLGSKDVASRKSKGGFAKLHILQTAKGNLGVWGKTDLDRKMRAVESGAMIRITQNGMVATPNGEMYKYKVEIDADNRIDVSTIESAIDSDDSSEETDEDAMDDLDNDELSNEEVIVRPVAPKVATMTPSADRQARMQAMLSRRKSAV